jgi:chromosome segregation ATPase
VESPAVPNLLIGALFVEKGLVTQEQLDIALEEQQRTGNRLGEVLVERFGVSRLDLASALAEQWAEYERQGTTEQQESHAETRDLVAVSDEERASPGEPAEDPEAAPKRPIGEIFVERGMISADELELALSEQRESGRRLGEILVEKGNLSRLELASALADQWATFQKLRPPAAPNGIPPLPSTDPDPSPVMPTPAVSPASPALAGATSDQVDALRARLEALGAQFDQLSVAAREWREPFDELSSSIDARLSAFEQPTSVGGEEASSAEIAVLEGRIDELAASLARASEDAVEGTPSAELSDRLEQLAAVVERQEVRIVELAATGEGDVERVGREEIAALEVRLDALAVPVAGLDELRASVADLASRGEGSSSGDEWREPFGSLADDLRARLDALAIAQVPSSAVDELRAELATLAGRIDGIPMPGEEWRAEIAALAARLDELASRPSEELDLLRTEIATLDARLTGLPVPGDEWRTELGQVAENLRARFERLEAGLAARSEDGSAAGQIAGLRDDLEELSARVAAIPVPSDEWREGLSRLSSRIDELPMPTDEWRTELGLVADNLRARFDYVEAELAGRAQDGSVAEKFDDLRRSLTELAARVDAIPGPSDEWREGLSQLSSRIDAIPAPSDEWRVELGQVAENLRARFEQVEAGLAARAEGSVVSEQLDGVRRSLSDLAARVDAIPEPNEDWREALDGLVARLDAIPDNLRVRLDRVDHDLAARAEQRAIADLARRVDGLAGELPERLAELRAAQGELGDRIDAIPPPSDEWRHQLAEVAENLRVRVERVETGLEQRPGLDLLAGLRDELAALSSRLDADLRERDERAAGQSAHVEWLAGRVAQAEGLEQRLRDEITPLVDGAVAPVADRLASVEASLDKERVAAAAVAPRLDDLAERLDKQARRIEKLRDEGLTATQIAESLRARLDASEAVGTDIYASFDERLTALDGQTAENSNRATSAVEALRLELADLRGATVAAAEASNAHTDQMVAQVRSEIATNVSAALEESGTREATERLDGLVAAQASAIEALQAGLGERERQAEERLAALEKSQAKRSDIRDLRDALGRLEQHIADETAKEDTRVAAVEDAVREGLAGLASRLAESEGAYFQAGDSLRRSIEHLGSAIRGADAQRASAEAPAPADAPAAVATSYLAFAPTAEGYHLVELDGAAPAVGDLVQVPGSESALVVARLGASPLPFDRRPCAYLETS